MNESNEFESMDRDQPVEEGKVYELQCVAQGAKNPTDGIFKYKGMVIIVPETDAGTVYNIRVTAIRTNVAFGEIAE